MGFNKVYKSLQEIFPQIDARALRAVAIEHSKDVDAAVEAVLEEIIPFFVERSRPSSPLTGSISVGASSEALEGTIASSQNADGPSVDTVDSDEVQNGYNVNSRNEQAFHDVDDGHNEPFFDTYGHHEGEANTAELTLSEETHENGIKISAYVSSHGEPAVFMDEDGVNALQIEVSGEPETEETILVDKCPENSTQTSSHSIPCHMLGTLHDVDMVVDQKMNLVQEREDFAARLETHFIMDASEDNVLEKSCGDGNNSVDGTTLLTVHDLTTSPLERCVQSVVVPHMHESNLEKLEKSMSTDTASKMETIGNIVGSEDESTLNTTMSQSSQTYMIDVLEEIIADARNNKKTLFSAMDSVISLMKEVELKEQAAEKAKEEAAIGGGTDKLDKVEELKRMLQHANDMHAGEVYGEKAILATELKELRSRVLSLSNERDKSLAVLDEMRQTLEWRVAAAENEIKSAELEKLEKEKAARKSLADQELIMEKVVQESNILKQQAEDNAKLQEFLVDRGRVVDMLQGEIAVICQDVRLLKEKFDEHVPFSKSLSSSQTSCILAASNSSLKSLIPDQVEPVPDRDESLENQKKRDHERVSDEEADGDDRKALLDDGWDFFDSHEIDA